MIVLTYNSFGKAANQKLFIALIVKTDSGFGKTAQSKVIYFFMSHGLIIRCIIGYRNDSESFIARTSGRFGTTLHRISLLHSAILRTYALPLPDDSILYALVEKIYCRS